jgi:hypothetical protein
MDLKKKEHIKIYPFLVDANLQDKLFAKRLVIEAPYAAKGNQTDGKSV